MKYLITPEAAAEAIRSISLPDVLTPLQFSALTGLPQEAIEAALERGDLPGRWLRDAESWLLSRKALLNWLHNP